MHQKVFSRSPKTQTLSLFIPAFFLSCHCENLKENDIGFALRLDARFQTIVAKQRKLCFWIFLDSVNQDWGQELEGSKCVLGGTEP